MESLIAQLNTLIQNNQIFSTIAGGSVIVWIVSNIKNMWTRLVSFVRSCISFTIVNTYEDARGRGRNVTYSQECFNDIIAASKPIWARTNNLDLSDYNDIRIDRITGEVKGSTKQHNLAYGHSIRILYGKLVEVDRSIEKNQKITCTTVLRVYFGFRKNFMARLNKDIEERVIARERTDSAKNTVTIYNGDCTDGEKTKRNMSSIFTKGDIHYKLLESIKTFINNKPIYEKLAYPHTYSALLYGEPGCGKTSTILAIASELNRNIEYVNLAKTTTSSLLRRLNQSKGDILVFEDIDALNTGFAETRKKDGDEDESAGGRRDMPVPDTVPDEKKPRVDDGCHPAAIPEARVSDDSDDNALKGLFGVSLSDILNFTDGLLASDDTICLFTTNHIEKLDPALLRAGRMNFLVEFTQLDAPTAAKMLKANLGWDVSPSMLKDRINPAELQEKILHVALGRATRDDIRAKFFVEQEGNEAAA